MVELFGEVNGFLVLAAVVGLVELAKSFGVSGKWSQLAAVLVGVAFVAGWYLLPGDVVSIVVYGLAMGLTAAGLYKVASRKVFDRGE